MMEAMAAEFVDASLLLLTRRMRKAERAPLEARGTGLFQIYLSEGEKGERIGRITSQLPPNTAANR